MEEALRESQSAFRELIELAPDAVVVGSADYHITDVNAAACKLYGYSREEFLGKTYVIEELTPQAFRGCDLVIASTPDDVAAKYLPAAVEAGATVIDESGYWRMKPEVALVIPEVNPEAALNAKGIIASPN